MKTSVLFFVCFFFLCLLQKNCDVAQLFSTKDGADLVSKQDCVYNDVREMSSGMCNQESQFLQKCVSAMLSQFAENIGGGGGSSGRWLSKKWGRRFREAALVTM